MASASDEWATPPELFRAIEEHLGMEFTLDVCATAENAKCHRFIGEGEDGASRSWTRYLDEVFWCNPPYSKPAPWVEKAIAEAKEGARGCMLLRSDTSTEWFHRGAAAADRVIFLTPRVKFLSAVDGRPCTGNPYGSVLFVFDSEFLKQKGLELWKWK